jgi:hypothetical protein
MDSDVAKVLIGGFVAIVITIVLAPILQKKDISYSEKTTKEVAVKTSTKNM